jgi:hypothetical protein
MKDILMIIIELLGIMIWAGFWAAILGTSIFMLLLYLAGWSVI